MEDIESGRLFNDMGRDAVVVCAVFLGLKVRIDDEPKEIDMCKVVRDYTSNTLRFGNCFFLNLEKSHEFCAS